MLASSLFSRVPFVVSLCTVMALVPSDCAYGGTPGKPPTTVSPSDSPLPGASKPLSLEEVLEAYEAACDALWAFDVFITTRYYDYLKKAPADVKARSIQWRRVGEDQRSQPAFTVRTRQYFLRGKFRIDSFAPQARLLTAMTSVWDGELFRQLNYPRNQGLLRPDSQTASKAQGPCLVQLYRSLDNDYTYGQLFRERSHTSVAYRGGFIVLSAEPELGEAKRAVRHREDGIRLYLDPAKGFMPVRIDVFSPSERVPRFGFHSELVEVEPGVWVPMRSTKKLFVWAPSSSPFYGRVISELKIEVDPTRSRFNFEIDEGVFRVGFPPGMVVHDTIRKTTYRVGAETREQYLDRLAVRARLSVQELQQTKPRMYPSFRSGRSWVRWTLIASNGLLLISLAGLFVFRWLRRRSP